MKQVALITGASSGIGAECAKIFAQKGFNLILTARSNRKLNLLKEHLESKYAVSILVVPRDLSEPDAAVELYKMTKEMGIAIDVLINNAGFGDYGRFLDRKWEKQENMVALNIIALMKMTYLFGNDMKKRGHGRILNLSSSAGLCAGPYMSVYYATKAFVLFFSQGVAEELKGTGVTVTALCPGPTSTNFEKAADAERSNLFKTFKNAKAIDVARTGYRAVMKGKVIASHGMPSYLLNASTHLLPKCITRKVMKMVNGKPD